MRGVFVWGSKLFKVAGREDFVAFFWHVEEFGWGKKFKVAGTDFAASFFRHVEELGGTTRCNAEKLKS